MNIRCSGHINSAEFLNGCSLYDKTIIRPSCLPGGGGGGGGGGGVVWLGMPRDIPLGRNRDCVPVFFSPSPKSDYTVSAITIVQFCM